MSLPSSPRYGANIIWVTLHTAEGARTVDSLYGFFDRNQNASSHAGADGYQLSGDWVPDERAAWTLLNGNPRSLNLEMCGFARWTRPQWLSEGWVDGVWNPRQMIRHAATWTRRKCDKYGIPRRLLTPAEVGQGYSGIIDHARYTFGTGDGDHTDVGGNLPWDVFFADLNSDIQPQPQPLEDDDMTTFFVKGSGGSPDIKAVTLTADGYYGRVLPESQWLVAYAAGKREVVINQVDYDNIPTADYQSPTGRAVLNYGVPTTPGENPAEYVPLHQLLAGINVQTSSQNNTP